MRGMVMRMMLTGVAAALLLMGCATAEMGRKFDTAAADRIEIGKTTEAEVLTLLGSPLQQIVKSDGTKAYAYSYHKIKAQMTSPFTMKSEGHGDRFIVVFTPAGVVSKVLKGSSPVEINK